MLSFIFSAVLSIGLPNKALYPCGYKEDRKQPYGNVEFRVECGYLEDNRYNNISLLEIKDDILYGALIHYDSIWRKKDSVFYLEDKKEGTQVFWDTLGNISGKKFFKKGIQFGKSEFFWAPGKPSSICNYNERGRLEGLEQIWWKNGNKKRVATYKSGIPESEEDYYENGNLRSKVLWRIVEAGGRRDQEIILMEYFTPKGKPTGKVINGSGEIWRIDEKLPPNYNEYMVIHEIYKKDISHPSEILSDKEAAKYLNN